MYPKGTLHELFAQSRNGQLSLYRSKTTDFVIFLLTQATTYREFMDLFGWIQDTTLEQAITVEQF
jgi:hypothetical protein